jgi:hypothetical protein
VSDHGLESVAAWPQSPAAREALRKYLDALTGDPLEVSPELAGDLLDFAGADLSGLRLGSAFLFTSNLAGVRLIDTFLARATLSGADMRQADLSRADLTKAEAVECDARGASFRGANLFAADLCRADLRAADLRETILNSVLLLGTDLRGADLRSASLRYARLGVTPDFAVRMSNARIFGCAVDEAKGFLIGPVDVGQDEPRLLDGAEVEAWFRERGAPKVQVLVRVAGPCVFEARLQRIVTPVGQGDMEDLLPGDGLHRALQQLARTRSDSRPGGGPAKRDPYLPPDRVAGRLRRRPAGPRGCMGRQFAEHADPQLETPVRWARYATRPTSRKTSRLITPDTLPTVAPHANGQSERYLQLPDFGRRLIGLIHPPVIGVYPGGYTRLPRAP